MKCSSVPSKLAVVLFFLAIPLLEARPLGVGKEDVHLSLLPSAATATESAEALVDYLQPEQSSDGEDEVLSGSPDDALHRQACSPPSPRARNPPHYRQPAGSTGAGRWGSAGAGVGGSRQPSRPPAPSGGYKPPHWRSSGDPPSPRTRHVFDDVLRVLSKMLA